MKKILSVLTAAAIISGAGSVYAEETDNGVYEKNSEILSALGISIDASAPASDIVTRAKFVSTVLSFANEDSGAYYEGTDRFYDVDDDYRYAAEIYAGAGLGYVVGYSNGYFYPDSPITYHQAVKVMVNVLGYEYRAESAGGYPNGYLATASALGITKNIRVSDGELDNAALVQLLMNSLEVNPLELSLGGDGSGTMSDAGENALWVFHRVMKIKEVINANEITGLMSAADATSKGYVRLGNELVTAGRTNAKEYLGNSVTAYVYYDEDEAEGAIKYIEPGTRNKIIRVEAENILGDDSAFSSSNFVYEDENERSKSVRITEHTAVIFNGIANPVFSIDDLIPVAGYVTLIDNDSNGSCDCILIFKATKTIIVDYAASRDDAYTIVDRFDPYVSYSYDTEYEFYDIQIDDVNNTYNSISAGMLVFIGENGEHSITRAYGESALLQGKIDSLSADKLTIGGVEYKISPLANKDSLSLNTTGTFWIYSGYVYGFKKGTILIDGEETGGADYSYAWLLTGVLYDDDNTGEPALMLKMLTSESEIERFETTDNTRFNGSKKKNRSTAAALFKKTDGSGDWQSQVVMYNLDNDGKIKEVYTAASEGKELRFEGIYDSSWHENEYSFYTDTWQNRFYQDDETIVFHINDGDPEQSYATGKFPSNTAIRNYIHEFYNVDEELNTVDVVVWHRVGATSQEADKVSSGIQPTIVKSVTQTLDADDMPIKTIIGSNGGATVTIEYNDKLIDAIKNEFNSISPGDIIYYELDGMGRLLNIVKSFDVEKVGEYGIATMNDFDKVHGIWKNNIHMARKDSYYKIEKKLPNDFISYIDGNGIECIQKIGIADAKFFRMTVRGSKVTVDTITYADVVNGDEVFCCYSYNRLQTMIVVDVQ